MGVFSWMFCDTNNKERLKIGQPGYLLLPCGSFLYESAYNGYGSFGGEDVFEVAAEMNRDYLDPDMVEAPVRARYQEGEQGDKSFQKAEARYRYALERMEDYKNGALSEEEMAEKYGKEWKREIGIGISCTTERNRNLPFPIKIASKPCDYVEMPASHDDPMQGCE